MEKRGKLESLIEVKSATIVSDLLIRFFTFVVAARNNLSVIKKYIIVY